ncbi:MAG: nicotinate-nucleotide adenylyltransferase [Candidatus Omnitrophica bacterium]|jgi:nicotinate-nucleotide adenylyltransferase|nr:nicotinate-nucleotide adenylyltransferase [Candidatus Omnitrophota bacterium]
MKIGILGGTFNPPHIGHLILAQDISEDLGLDKVFFIPTNISPHKSHNEMPAEKRLEMVKLAISDNKKFEVLDLEVKRGGTSYTIDTVRELKVLYPKDEFYLIVGSDLANYFLEWKDFGELTKLVKIVVAQRKESPLKNKDSFIIRDITQINISSSLIRAMIKQRRTVRYLLSDKVRDYIVKNKFYLT